MLREAARVAGLSLRVSEGGLKAVISQFQSRPTYQVTGAMQDLRLGSSVERETHILFFFFFFYTHRNLESRALMTVFARAHTHAQSTLLLAESPAVGAENDLQLGIKTDTSHNIKFARISASLAERESNESDGKKKKTGRLEIRQSSEPVLKLIERLQSMATVEEAAFTEEYQEG